MRQATKQDTVKHEGVPLWQTQGWFICEISRDTPHQMEALGIPFYKLLGNELRSLLGNFT